MTKQANESATCKAVCWIIGLVAGGYLTFILVTDFKQDLLQSAVLGIVAVLVAGLLMRRLFCRRGGNKIQDRIQDRMSEARVRSVKSESRTAEIAERVTRRMGANAAVTTAAAEAAQAMDADAEPETLTLTPNDETLEATVEKIARHAAQDDQDDETTEIAMDEDYEEIEDDYFEEPEPKPAPIPVPTPAPAIEPVERVTIKPADFDPVKAAKPKLAPGGIASPDGRKPDNLQMISGVNAKGQKSLNDAGIYYFDQIAAMEPEGVVWMDTNIEGAEGLATKQSWTKQADVLASGEDTRYSARLKAGTIKA